jgi:hypothetical protein
MLRAFTDTLYSTPIINAITLSRELNCLLTKTSVRELFFSNFREKDGEPIINEYQLLLNRMGIETIVAKLPKSKIADAPVPFLIILDKDDIDFSCVTEFDKTSGDLTINQSNIIIKRNLQTDFTEESYVVLLISAVSDADFGEKDLEYRNLEIENEERYRKSIRILDNFLSEQECNEIICYCNERNNFKQSMVYNHADVKGKELKNTNIYSKDRTSSNMELKGYGKVDDLYHKLCKAFGCGRNQLEPISCIKYEKNQQFKYHHDFIQGGDRIFTAVIYLNNDFEGGELRFPEIDLTYKSKTGSCIIFQNIDESQQLIPESMHGSLPITAGVKYAIPVFMHINPVD